MEASSDSRRNYSSIDDIAKYELPGQKQHYISDFPEDYNVPKLRDFSIFMPSLPIQRVPQHILGYGVLGRCFTGTTLIQIRDDLYGSDFQEVDIHELKHAVNPGLSEYSVRQLTRAMLGYTRYN